MSATSKDALAAQPTINPILTVSFSNEQGGPLNFYNKQEIADWISAELNFWSWMFKGNSSTDPYLAQAIDTLRGSLTHLERALTSAQKNIESLDVDYVRPHLETWRKSKTFHSKSPKAQVIFKINELHGHHSASAAFAHTKAMNFSVFSPESFIGVLQYHLLNQGITMESNSVLLNTFERTQREAVRELESLNEGARALIASARETREKTANSFDTLKRWHHRKWNIFVRDRKKEADAEVEKMHQIQKLYSEHMNIKAPVDYWEKKGREHLKKAQSRRNILLFYTGAAVGILALGIYAGWHHLIGAGNGSMYVAFTMLLLATTILFWAARLLVRLYLSELHLGMDSNERAIMAKTYLALINDNQVEKTDRNIVLSALFRPTTDGIIKEDAAPMLSPASFAASKL